MAIRVPSDLQVLVNNDVTCIVPKSLKWQDSQAKNVVKACTVGGTSVETVHSRDNSEAVGKVTFSIRATTDNISKITQWYDNIAGNVIELSDKDGEVVKVFIAMSLEAIPEMQVGAEAELEVTFLGDSII